MSYTADQVRLLNKIIRMSDKSIPAKPGESAIESKKDLQDQLGKLLSDPDIRNNHDKKRQAEELAKRIAEN